MRAIQVTWWPTGARTCALVLIDFYHVPLLRRGALDGLAFAIGNQCGLLLLGPLFD